MSPLQSVLPVAFLVCLTTPAIAETYQGQVFAQSPDFIILHGTNWTGWVNTSRQSNNACAEGDIVRVTGKLSDAQPLQVEIVTAESIEIIGHKELPTPREVPGGRIANGSLEFTFVRSTGIVVSVSRGNPGRNWIVLRSQTGDFGVSIRENHYSLTELRQLIDAEVSVSGIVACSWDKHHLGAHLSLKGDNALKVLKPAPADPFAAPLFDKIRPTHRQLVQGIITAKGETAVMIRTAKFGTIKAAPSEGAKIPSVGHAVTVVGFASTDPVRLMLTEALFRDEGPDESVNSPPVIPNADDLRSGDLHGTVITLQGVVSGHMTKTGVSDFLSLETEHGLINIDISSIALTQLPPEHGTVLSVTGVCLTEYENASVADAFPRLRGITIITRSPDDIIILKTPPWWTLGKLALCLALLVFAACLREWFVRSTVKIKLRERTSLAIELHDFLAQFLTGVSLQLDAAYMAQNLEDGDKTRLHIANAREALRSCRENLRYCLGDLRRSTSTWKNLEAAIVSALRPYLGETTLRVRFPTSCRPFSDVFLHAIISIARELAINAVRHGHANCVRIAGEWQDGSIRFSVRDDGCGFDPSLSPGLAQGHYGLQGIRERLRTFKGKMSISSHPGRGTSIRISLIP